MMNLTNDMIIVAIPNCKACIQAMSRYPHVQHIVLDAKSASPEVLAAKKAVTKLKVAGYPVILNSTMTKVIGYTNPMPKEGMICCE